MDAPLESLTTRCIRCGFCLDACPTYRLTGEETRSPRGRIYLVRSWQEGAIDLDAGVVDALDTCLGCRACETACPSGVEYGQILEGARAAIEEAALRPPAQRRARRLLLRMLTTPALLRLMLAGARALRAATGGFVPGPASALITGRANARIRLPAVRRGAGRRLPQRSAATTPRRATVAILEGCVMREMYGDVNEATVAVLQANGCDVIVPAASCCGALHLHCGYEGDALMRARGLVDALTPHLDSIDAFVVNSAGCGSTIREYAALLGSDPRYAGRAERIAALTRDVCEFLDALGVLEPTARVDAVVTYHDACHLAHGQRVREAPRRLLARIPGLRLVELDEADTCCGSAGVYNITEPALAERLLERKVANIAATGCSVVATGNPGCLAWIAQGLDHRDPPIRVAHTVELLAEAYRGASA